MPVTVPPSLLIVLQVLRPCFTAPSFVTLAALVTGALSGAGRRTVTGMWQAAGLAGRVHWSRAHRFFARAVWDLDQVGLALARAVVARLVPDGGAVTVAVDDTLFHRYGKKVHGARYQHDGSARGRDGIGRGNCFVIVGVVAAVPFLARQVCLPVLFRLHIPKTSASKTEQARAMVDLLARRCPGAPSTWWRRPASADRPGAACPPASLHHPPGRQRGPGPRHQPGPALHPGPGHHRPGQHRRADRGQVRLPLVIEQSIKDGKNLLGTGDAQSRLLPTAVQRTTPLGRANLTILVLWYDQAGQPAADLGSRRRAAPWYRHKRHGSTEDMIIAFRRARVTGNTAAQDTPALFDAPASTSQAAAA